MGKAVGGTAYINVDGAVIDVVGECTWDVAKVSRETATGMDRVHGFIEKPKAPHIGFTYRDRVDLSVAQFNAMRDVTVVIELNNGKVITGRNMWSVGDDTEVDTETGSGKVRFEGADGAVTEN